VSASLADHRGILRFSDADLRRLLQRATADLAGREIRILHADLWTDGGRHYLKVFITTP